MTPLLHDFSSFPTVLLLIGFELVLGIDNVLVVSLLAAGFDPGRRRSATVLGLAMAVALRFAALGGMLALLKLERPWVGSLSGRDLVVIAGGAFLIWRAVAEIHREVEHPRGHAAAARPARSFLGAVLQIAALDLVFSIDSLVAAVGLTPHFLLIAAAIVVSFGVVILAASAIAGYLQRNPSLRLLCLAFLVCIGASLALDGFHQHFPRGYLYAPMCFALAIELLHGRRRRNLRRPLR
jgi:predicted tellurium resistance membrane protein TerC